MSSGRETSTIDFENGIVLSERAEGLLVRQFNDAYVARRWKLTTPTVELVQTAIESGLDWMIRQGHPQPHAHWPTGQGRVYLAFSPTREDQWSVAIDTFDERTGNYGHAVFNGKYHEQFLNHSIPFEFEKRNRKSGHLVVQRDAVLGTIRKVGGFNHSVLNFGTRALTSGGFGTEYDIQRALLSGWSNTPLGRDYKLIQDEFPVDTGANPRRIDILAKNDDRNEVLAVEIKRAQADSAVINQIASYLDGLGGRFEGSRLVGALVAERIPESIRDDARRSNIMAFEISYPLVVTRVV